MYLFVWADRTAKQFRENLTAADYLSARQGLLSVFRLDADRDRFLALAFDGPRPCWVPVKDGRVCTSADARVHL